MTSQSRKKHLIIAFREQDEPLVAQYIVKSLCEVLTYYRVRSAFAKTFASSCTNKELITGFSSSKIQYQLN